MSRPVTHIDRYLPSHPQSLLESRPQIATLVWSEKHSARVKDFPPARELRGELIL